MPPPSYDDEILGQAFDARLARKAYVFAKPHKVYMIRGLIGMLITAGLGLLTPQLMQIAIDRGMAKGNARVLTGVALIYITVYVIQWISRYFQNLNISYLGQHVIFDIRHKLFSHIQDLSLSFFDRREVGRIIARLTSDVAALSELITSGTLGFITDFITLIAVVIIMTRENLHLSLLIFTLTPLVAATWLVFRRKARLAYRDVRRKVATVTATVAENVSGVRVVKSFSRERENLKRFKEVNRDSREAYMHSARIGAVFHPVIEFIGILGMCLVFWYGGMLVIKGVLTVGVVIAMMQYTEKLFTPIQNMSQLYATMQSAMAGAERIFEILDTEAAIQDKPNADRMPRIEGNVVFQDVNFAYGDTPILKNVSFEAKAGETIALVGPTGAGKTTIINLLGRQYDVQSGAILVDGHDIRDVTMKSLRSQMGIVLQDSFLFPGSVKDNIRYGRLDATDQEVRASAETVGADEFILQMPEKYDTDVREGGSKLSTGQKQIISFARALLADPRILILDEATSSVDAKTEMLIQEALRKLLRGRTSFVIAHRLSTIAEADKILVIDGGRIVETGTHEELLAHDGMYRKLHDMQFNYGLAISEAVEAE